MPRAGKRILDIFASLFLIVLLAPLMLVIVLLVAFSSPGGAFFRQVRTGRFGSSFKLLKFRTMRTTHEAETESFDAGDTSRVTSVGRILRRTKLDELPQLWNVLIGDMSLVGPRPEVPTWTKVHSERWATVLTVRPGITDPASIMFRFEEEILSRADDPEACYRDEILPRKLDLSEQYVQNQTFHGDLIILARTLLSVLGIGVEKTPTGTGQTHS